MNFVKVQIPCRRDFGQKRVTMLRYSTLSDQTLVFGKFNGCDFMDGSPECSQCLAEEQQFLQNVRDLDTLVMRYQFAK